MHTRAACVAAMLAVLPITGGCDGTTGGGRNVSEPMLVAQRAFPKLSFEAPLFLTHAPGASDRLFVVTQGGVVRTFENRADVATSSVFLDISDRLRSGGEEGLLGLAFDPGYANNGHFYVYYTAKNDPRRSVLSRFSVSNDALLADPGSEQVLLEIAQPYRNHNGGMLAFGPDDKLYVAVGDGGSGGDPQNHGQRLDSVLGSILRLNTDGSAPPDNPFAGTEGARPEIWAYGLRNPWRFSFDRSDGTLWAADVGQNAEEEIDIIVKGGNYGWRYFEGNSEYENPDDLPASNFVAPVATYSHDFGCSVTGGYVYRGKKLGAFIGHYFYSDFCSGRVWALSIKDGNFASNTQVAAVPSPSSFGEDAAGELYITSFNGNIYKLAKP